jgi:short-subunit dehydrogenase
MKIVLCTREDPIKVRDALKQLLTESIIENNIRIQSIDLSDLSSVEAAVQEIKCKEKKIDLLLNCAGISSIPSRQLTAQNFELQLGEICITCHRQ